MKQLFSTSVLRISTSIYSWKSKWHAKVIRTSCIYAIVNKGAIKRVGEEKPLEYTRLQHWQAAEGAQQNRNDPKVFK